jgi:hypothetical protein
VGSKGTRLGTWKNRYKYGTGEASFASAGFLETHMYNVRYSWPKQKETLISWHN